MSDKKEKKFTKNPIVYLLVEDERITHEFAGRRDLYSYLRTNKINPDTTRIFRASEKKLVMQERTIRKPALV